MAVESKVAEAGAMRLEFVYDYMGRRIRKEVFTFLNGGIHSIYRDLFRLRWLEYG